jgi:hypothetical protein
LFVFLDLRIQARYYALEAPQPLEQLGIRRLPALARRATRTWEDAFDLGANAIRAWLFLVAFDLPGTGTSECVPCNV